MKTKTHRILSFLIAIAMCVPMFLGLTAPASAATSQIAFTLSTSACQGNLSTYSLPAHNSKVSVGQALYINVAATSDIMLKTIEAYVGNGGNYTLVGRETARNYLRWSAFEYIPTTPGSLTILVKVYYTNGRTAQGTVTVSVMESPSSGNSMIWNGKRYTVVPNATVSLYHYNQKNYSRFVNSSGRNVGCTATAMASAYSILHNTAVSPASVRWSSSGCSWELAKRLTDNGRSYSPYTYSTQEALQAVYRSVNNRGVPVIVGVTGAGVDHVVTAIGFRDGANPSNLSLSDILIIDPNGGQVCSLAKYSGVDTGWSLRVPI